MNGYLPEPALSHTVAHTEGGNAAFHNFHNDYSHISDPNLRRRLALAEIDKVINIAPSLARPDLTYSTRCRSGGITYEQ
jgi:hypothetical protein